jgi:hypothetical protein
MAKKKSINFDLSSIAEGGLQEKVDRALAKVTENILDPNTDTKKKRKVTINITLAPDDNRYTVDVDTDVKVTLAPDVGVSTILLVDEDNGAPVVNELKSGAVGQTYIDDDGTQRTDTGESVDKVEQENAVKKDAGPNSMNDDNVVGFPDKKSV